MEYGANLLECKHVSCHQSLDTDVGQYPPSRASHSGDSTPQQSCLVLRYHSWLVGCTSWSPDIYTSSHSTLVRVSFPELSPTPNQTWFQCNLLINKSDCLRLVMHSAPNLETRKIYHGPSFRDLTPKIYHGPNFRDLTPKLPLKKNYY